MAVGKGVKATVLVTDDEKGMREFLAILLKKEGYEVTTASSGASALKACEKTEFDLLISDIRMPDLTGIDLLREVKKRSPRILVVLITAYASTATAIEALKLGAHDYITKPFDVEEFKIVIRKALESAQLQRENAQLRQELRSRRGFETVVGKSASVERVLDLINRVADTTATILLTGERGTGKEVLARAVHEASPRREQKFVSLNCAAVQESLLESELFGHVRGAFTGASTAHAGLFETADRGTILLDEIGEMSTNMQAKLLRVLQEMAVRRVGGSEEVQVDVRVIASTNRDLTASVAAGEFRADLYDRLNVIAIEVPPLRERRDDVPLLVEHFLRRASQEMGRELSGIDPDALRALEAYTWPGNVRELENVIRRAVALATGGRIQLDSLPDSVLRPVVKGEAPLPALGEGFQLEDQLEAMRKRYMEMALAEADGRMVDAARLLGVTFRAFRYYAKKYVIR